MEVLATDSESSELAASGTLAEGTGCMAKAQELHMGTPTNEDVTEQAFYPVQEETLTILQ